MPQVYWAIQNGRYDTLKHLVDSGINVNMLSMEGEPFDIEEIRAEKRLTYSWLDLLINLDALCTPLALAAHNGQDSMVGLLLDSGADIELASAKLCECCNVLLRCSENLPEGPTISEESDYAKNPHLSWLREECKPWWAPLHYAICEGHFSTMKLLLERGANARDISGNEGGVTALHSAVRHGRRDMIEYLLDNHIVGINDQSDHGVTALHLAYACGRYDLADGFLDGRGANINLKYEDESGPWTIFSMACANGHFGRALEYLRRGADPNFVIQGVNHDDGAWTVMRFIYGSPFNVCPDALGKDDLRIVLEQEIIRSGRETTLSDSST